MLLVGRYFLVDHGLALAKQITLINFLSWSDIIKVLPLVLAVGILMPAVAALVALRKYLKV
jgi:cell division transport system permease protein